MGFAFALGFTPVHGAQIAQIPRDQWAEELERMHAEEEEWWGGSLVSAHLAVELPFWLMIPDGKISLAYGKTTVVATINGKFLELSDGPMSLTSKNNAVVIGPGDDVWNREPTEAVVPSRMPVYRPMKTVLVFETEVVADCFEAWRNKANVAPGDHTGIRRVNRVMQYLKSLATAHIPFVNRLITSYRSASLDPYAFEVSEWDVPAWFAEHEGTLVRIGLIPYWDEDTYPTVNRQGRQVPFFATSLDEVQLRAGTDVTPGELELLDAYSLMYRGRFGDAVRSAVTAIEVAVEAQLTKLLRQRGRTEEQIKERLSETMNSFFERLQEYEHLSQKRLPGPILSEVPYINGVRLRSELDWVRNLRHKVVHEGIRIDVTQRGATLRAVETMSWLFDWLSWDNSLPFEDNENYSFFSMLRGMPFYPSEYTESGVRVVPHEFLHDDKPPATADQMIFGQYLTTTERGASDVDLMARMTFEFLRVACDEGPPEPTQEPRLRERYVITDGHRKAIVFCLEFDNLIDAAAVGAIVARVLEVRRENSGFRHALVILHHQRHQEKGHRVVDESISDDLQRILDALQVTAITALDLQLLIRGGLEFGWPVDSVKDALFTPGRQGQNPPIHDFVGNCRKYYPKHSVVSVELHDGKTVRCGELMTFRLPDRYHEEEIVSMQIHGEAVMTAQGPCRVGIVTKLPQKDAKPGLKVFARTRSKPTGRDDGQE